MVCGSGGALACPVDEAVFAIYLKGVQHRGERAEQHLAILADQERIIAKTKDPVRPIGEQLAATDLAEFSRLEQRGRTLTLYNMIESHYERDAKVIGELFELANTFYLVQREPAEKDPGYDRFLMLAAMRLANDRKELRGEFVTTPKQITVCTLEVALHFVERESVKKLNKLEIDKALSEATSIHARNKKTPDGKIDRRELSFQDRAVLDRLQRDVLTPARREKGSSEIWKT